MTEEQPRSSRPSDPTTGEHLAVGTRRLLGSWPILAVALVFGGGGLGASSLVTRPELTRIQESIGDVQSGQDALKTTLADFVRGSAVSEERRAGADKRIDQLEEDYADVCRRVRDLELDKAARDGRRH